MSNVMTSEFNDRIAAQRSILRAVNSVRWESEPLLGLSKKAIDRWIALNKIEAHSSLANLVAGVSSKLFFLANKSQDQVSEEYQLVRSEIIAARDAIVRAMEARQT
jgi:hypothetical protein